MANHRVGHKRFDTPQKDHHKEHFEEALIDALNQWNKADNDPTEVDVIFQATVSPNPGGIGHYRAIIKTQTQTFDDEDSSDATS